MSASEMERSKPYVQEKWWHRLLRVLGYGLTLLVLTFSLVTFVENADYFTYSYSFEPNYAASAGDQFDCHAYESLKSISCGALSDGAKFIEYYLSVKGDDKIKDGPRSVNEFFAELRSKGHKDADLAVSLIGQKGFTYRRQRHWDGNKLVVAILSALGFTLGSFVGMFGAYKVILFVVHGHTRVLRKKS